MVTIETGYFDLQKICDSGQIFRMYGHGDGSFDVFSQDRHLCLWQQGEKVDLSCTEKEFDSYWRRYFDLDRDYGKMAEAAMKKTRSGRYEDEFVARACAFGAGIRILHQDIWEMLISFIISQQKQIPSIRKCIEALCERFGEKKQDTDTWYAFPTAEAIASGGPEGLKGLSLGYRERYIYETAVRYLTEGLPYDKVENMGLEAALDYFTSFCGVGVKVANCVCLFGAGYVDAFPIDTHIKDILYWEYYLKDTGIQGKVSAGDAYPDTDGRICSERGYTGKKPASDTRKKTGSGDHGLSQADYEELVRVHFDRYRGYRGIVQQWIFANEISGRDRGG